MLHQVAPLLNLTLTSRSPNTVLILAKVKKVKVGRSMREGCRVSILTEDLLSPMVVHKASTV